jgi:protein-glutamine gamma-glutamyltransferase
MSLETMSPEQLRPVRLWTNIRVRRTIEVLPILFAMAFHAIAMERWLLIAPASIAVIYAILRSSTTAIIERSTSRQWYGVVIAGLLLGMLMPAADVSNGVLPPAGASAMTGIAVAICLYAVFTCQLTVGWVAAWALVAISGKSEMVVGLRLALLGFLVASLVAASLHAGVLKNRIREMVMWGMLVAAIASSTVLISVLIARVDQLFLGTFERLMVDQPKAAATGLSDRVTLGTKSTINPSRQPLLELSQLPGLLRVNVMDDFNGNQWTTSSKLKAQIGRLDGALQAGADSRSIEMLFLDDLDNSIPSPAGTSRPRNASARFEGGWVLRGKPDGVAVTILANSAQQLPPESIDGFDLLAVPDDLSASLAPVAKRLTGDASSAASNLSKAKSIEAFFHQNFQYSLTTDLSGEKHPLVTLIEERRPAYCIYFASAMALMLRTQGVPSRVVTGYAPGDVNALSGRVIVRASDSHAWVEVWSAEDKRFVAFDPTPGESRREIMGHSERVGMFQAAASALRSSVHRLWLLMRYQPLTGIKALLVSPLLWLGIGGLVWLWRKRSRRSLTQLHSVTSMPLDARLEKQYDRYVALLRKAGVDPKPFETDDELLARLEATGDQSLWNAANRFIHRYRSVRFGGALLDETIDEFTRSR